MRRYRAIFFDMGGTLVHADYGKALVLLGAKYGLEFDEEKVGDAWKKANEHFEDDYINRFPYMSNEERYNLDLEFNEFVLMSIGIEDNLRFYALKIYEELGEFIELLPFPETEEVLGHLKQDGYILGIISNWSNILSECCSRLGLSRYFNFILSSAVERSQKPDSAIFQKALVLAGVKPEEAIHIGDFYETDVLGARGVGITPILIDRDSGAMVQFVHFPTRSTGHLTRRAERRPPMARPHAYRDISAQHNTDEGIRQNVVIVKLESLLKG